MKRVPRFFSGTVAAVVSLSSLMMVGMSGVAHAASIAWDGGGSDNNFSTAANWVGDVVPTDGDALTFSASSLLADETVNNDLSNLNIAGLTVTGSSSWSYIITGNPLTISGDINVASHTAIGGNVTLGANINVQGYMVDFGDSLGNTTLDLNGYTLTISTMVISNSHITGAGDIAVAPNAGLYLEKSSTFTGGISVDGSFGTWVYVSDANSLGDPNNTVTINGDYGHVALCGLNGATINNNFVLNNAKSASLTSVGSCGGGAPVTQSDPRANVTLAGTLTLQADSIVESSGVTTISGPLLGAYTLTLADGQLGSLVINSSDNKSKTPNSTLQSSVKTTEVTDKQPLLSEVVSPNEVLIIKETGERGTVTINGGILKGTGTVGDIALNLGSLAPGMSPGVLNSGDFTATAGSYDVEIGGTTAGQYDQLNVTGTVSLGGATTLNVSLWGGFVPALNNTFVIINNDGSDAVTGAFQGLAEGATFEKNGVVFKISYVGGDGNDVVLTAQNVPAVPDTGFALVTANPLLSLGLMTVAAGLIFAIARRTRLSQEVVNGKMARHTKK